MSAAVADYTEERIGRTLRTEGGHLPARARKPHPRRTPMLSRLALTVACLTVCSQTANARRISLTCEAIVDLSGERTQRVVEIDTTSRIVRDNTMTWTDGMTNPIAGNLEQFVTVTDGVATWGDRTKEGGTEVTQFTLDLRTGNYAAAGSLGRLGHGTCRRTGDAI